MGWDEDSLIEQERNSNNDNSDNNIYKAIDAQCNRSPPADQCPGCPQAVVCPQPDTPYLSFSMNMVSDIK